MSNLHYLNIALFGQLNRLQQSEDLPTEIERSKSMSAVARDIISVNRLALDAAQFDAQREGTQRKLPSMLGVDEGDTIEAKATSVHESAKRISQGE